MDDLGEVFFGLLMQVRNGNTSSENRVVRVFRRQIRSSLRGQVLALAKWLEHSYLFQNL